jgi:hypothetical protein
MKISSKLAQMQLEIQECVRHGNMGRMTEIIFEKPPISVEERLKIYQKAYRIRLLESLRDDFPKVENLLGATGFEKLAHQYIDQNPSMFQNLAEYSEAFPQFLYSIQYEAGHLALQDWIEIVNNHSSKPEDQVSLEFVQSGKSFKVKLHPAVKIQLIKDDEVTETLDFLRIEKSLQEVEGFIIEKNLDADKLSSLITDWIQTGIVYCLADKGS